MDIVSFSNFNFSLDLILDLAFYASIGAYAIFTAIFYYHWSAFGTDIKVTGLTLIVYFATTVPILITMSSLRFLI